MSARISLVFLLAASSLLGCEEDVVECRKGFIPTYLDADGDGFGDGDTLDDTCGVPEGRSTNNGDCDDSLAESNVEAEEICDGFDNNCNGIVDDGLEGLVWYEDSDGDGYGNPEMISDTCIMPDGYVDNGDDCWDEDAAINPGAEEVCDGRDNDCNELADGRDGDLDCGEWIEDFELGMLDAYWSVAQWRVNPVNFYEGGYGATSSNIGDGQSTALEVALEFTADGELSFWFQGDSESNYDFLRFKIDGVEMASWSGSYPWTQHVLQVPSGPHILRWEYTKDGSVSTGADAYNIDLIESTNTAL